MLILVPHYQLWLMLKKLKMWFCFDQKTFPFKAKSLKQKYCDKSSMKSTCVKLLNKNIAISLQTKSLMKSTSVKLLSKNFVISLQTKSTMKSISIKLLNKNIVFSFQTKSLMKSASVKFSNKTLRPQFPKLQLILLQSEKFIWEVWKVKIVSKTYVKQNLNTFFKSKKTVAVLIHQN